MSKALRTVGLVFGVLLLLPGTALADDPPPQPGTGGIAGTVTDASTSSPIQEAKACAYNLDFDLFDPDACAETNASGQYSISGLVSGEYKVEFFAPAGSNYARLYYGGAGGWNNAALVSVTEPHTTGSINAQMKQGGRISGRVTSSSTSFPIQGIRVCARVTGEVTGEGAYDGCAVTNGNGEYLISGLASLLFRVSFRPLNDKGPNYIREYYDNKPFFLQATFDADAVQVVAPATTSGIDAALDPGGTITGTVTDEVTSEPIEGVEVCAIEDAHGDDWGCTHTDANGDYTMIGLASKQYRVVFRGPWDSEHYDSEYLRQIYDRAFHFYAGNLITMTAPNTITGIDGYLRKEGSITGKVTDETTGDPIQGAWVCAFLEGFTDPEYRSCTGTGSSGEYQVRGLSTGPHTIEFWANPQGYLAEFYDNKTYLTADMVDIDYGVTTTGINAALAKNLKPINTEPPVISGMPVVGQTLSCSSGSWSNDPTDFVYQWELWESAIPGQTQSTYTIQPSDRGTLLSCHVTASNDHGSAAARGYVFVPEDQPSVQRKITVNIGGTGTGSVISSPPGIHCGTIGAICSAQFDEGETVTLTPTPDSGSSFLGWGWPGDECVAIESALGACTLTVTGDTNLEATFKATSDEGGGSPFPPDINPGQPPVGAPPPALSGPALRRLCVKAGLVPPKYYLQLPTEVLEDHNQ